MKTFEYLDATIPIGYDPGDTKEAMRKLNDEYGAQGWEIVTRERKTASLDNGKTTIFVWNCLLKRERVDAAAQNLKDAAAQQFKKATPAPRGAATPSE